MEFASESALRNHYADVHKRLLNPVKKPGRPKNNAARIVVHDAAARRIVELEDLLVTARAEITALKAKYEPLPSKATDPDPEPPPPPPILIADVLKATAIYFKTDIIEITSVHREARIVYWRHIAMYLARKLTPRGFSAIGRHIGDRDHTTAMHAFRRIERLRQEDIDVDLDICEIEKAIRAKIQQVSCSQSELSGAPVSLPAGSQLRGPA